MITTQIARIIADFILFLNLTDDETLDPDTAVKMMEALAGDLQALEKGFLRKLIDAFSVIAPEYSSEAQKLVRNISLDFYLEDVLAGDDPIKLAELDAQRGAED